MRNQTAQAVNANRNMIIFSIISY